MISQIDKTFMPGHVKIDLGQSLTVLNNDVRPHNVTVFNANMRFNSGVQDPGEQTVITFNKEGTFEAFCGIHPNMRLMIDVK